jgi:hypothetical protein
MIQFQDFKEMLYRKDRYGNPIPFAIEWVTADVKKQKGGDVLSIPQAVYVFPRGPKADKKRNLDRFMHGIIDIKPLGSRKITSVHVQLVRRVNNKTLS